MTKKDYELIAKAIGHGINGNTIEPTGDVMAICTSIADALANNNSKFDKERFLLACGVTI